MAAPMAGEERLEAVRLREALPEAFLHSKVHNGECFLCVKREKIREVITFLKTDPALDYSYFAECLGVDYSTWEHERDFPERFEVVYNLMSLQHFSRVFVKIGVNEGESVASITDIFLGADYPEKEVADLFGIPFDGNVTEGRFLLPDDWIGFPLRKEYPLGGEDVLFDKGDRGPAVEDVMMPHAGESFEGNTGSDPVSGR